MWIKSILIYLQIGKCESEILHGGQVLLSKLLCDLWQVAKGLRFLIWQMGVTVIPAYCSTNSNHMWSTHNIPGTILGTLCISSGLFSILRLVVIALIYPVRKLKLEGLATYPQSQLWRLYLKFKPKLISFTACAQISMLPLKKHFVISTTLWTSHLKCH